MAPKNGPKASIFNKIRWPQRPKKRSSDASHSLASERSFDTNDKLVTSRPQSLVPSSESPRRDRSRSRDRRAEPQGLNILYEPLEARIADIILVHGLGGSSITTWTKDGDDNTFWPEKFLPSEPVFSKTRILSFGYTAFFTSSNAAKQTNITDFARSLLANLKNDSEISVGQVGGSSLPSERILTT
ncbi:MAG: hypothetical protein Q9167_003724 [Letrouitia subvulpina]